MDDSLWKKYSQFFHKTNCKKSQTFIYKNRNKKHSKFLQNYVLWSVTQKNVSTSLTVQAFFQLEG